MPKYLSGRAKRVPQDQLSDDRYRYLGLDQAEPNLSDPLVSPSAPTGAQYQLVAVPGFPGKRYWVPVGGGLVPGAITIFDENSPVSSSSSITQLNFVGAAVTANVSVQSPSGHPGIAATVTVIPVSVTETPPNYPTPNEGELWWESDTGDLYIYYNDGDSAQWVQTNAGGRGLAGDKGQKGEVGPQGLTGNDGAKGDKGEKGQKGDVEAQGSKGQKGEQGAGQKGQKGEAGVDGSDGDKGQKGEDNTTKGDKGQKGEIGVKGEKGAKGDSGGGSTVTISDNAPGSASTGDLWWASDDFDLHVYYGDGDSNQWVSITSNAALKGQKGEKGEKGQKGEKGEKGEKGQKGELGLSGGPGGKGQKGEKGEKGQKGEKGEKGQKGLKGEDNSTKGQKGEKGEKGQKGVDGNSIKGTKGEKGEKGEKGQKGLKGEDNSTKGQKGDAQKGEKGQKGQDGADNSTKGQKGQKGEVGLPGSATKGEKGQKGEDNSTKGQKGEDGTAGSTGIPSGFIGMWSGSQASIPSGWYLCDGNNNTPDLRNRFVVGAGTGGNYSVGDSGGHTHINITASQLPAHTHSFSGNTGYFDTSHTHGYTSANHPTSSGPEQNQSGGPEDRTTFNVSKNTGGPSANSNHRHSFSGTTGSTGSGSSVENRPPYYALCYIMKA